MDPLERLQAIEEIKALKARYFRYCDGKEWDKFEQLFTPDLVCESVDDNPTPVTIRGAREFVDATKSYLGPSVSIHHGHTPEIAVLTPTTATGIWVMQDTLTWTNGDPLHGFKKLVGWGHYYESYRKVDDGWRIATWKLTRIRIERTK